MRQTLRSFSTVQLLLLTVMFTTLMSCSNPQTDIAKQTKVDSVAANMKENTSDSSLIIKAENDWAKALPTRDKNVFNKLLADDFFYTENEKMFTRAEVIQSAMSPSETVEKAYNEDMQVHIKENTAIVTGWLFVNGKSAENEFKRKYRFTDIWFKKSGNWQLIGAHDYIQ